MSIPVHFANAHCASHHASAHYRPSFDTGWTGVALARSSFYIVPMAKSLQRWTPASSRRLMASLAGSALLHAGSIALLAAEWRGTIRQPALAPPIEARLRQLPPVATAAAPADRLMKDTLSESPAPPTAIVSPPRVSPSEAVRTRATEAARTRSAQRRLASHVFYPPEAVAAGIEGEVRLLLTLDSAGNVVEAAIASGSGHAVLDRAALSAAYAMKRLPGAGARELILPVVFRLE